MRNSSAAHRRPVDEDSIRRYSLHWLLQAASRVYQRGMDLYHENERQLLRGGVSCLFDLSDTVAPVRRRPQA